jgi:ASPIC and UnbV
MFRNDSGKPFQEVTTAGNFGHLQKGHAIVFGDVDNDGDQDVFEQMGGAYLGDRARSALYRNPGTSHGWLGIELEGVRSNRRGVGARFKLAVESPAGIRHLHRTVGSGGSFGGNAMRQEIGLGPARRVEWLEVVWPATGLKLRVTGLAPGRRYRVREGVERAEEVAWPVQR